MPEIQPATPPQIVFVTGPSGAGKSTTAEAWAASRSRPCALISPDHIRTFIKAGYANPELNWGEAAEQQWSLARIICGQMVTSYHAAGIDCILEAFCPPCDLPVWLAQMPGLAVQVVVLLPALSEVLARNVQRSGTALMRAENVRENYSWMEVWRGESGICLVDTTHLSIDEVIQAMEQGLTINQVEERSMK